MNQLRDGKFSFGTLISGESLRSLQNEEQWTLTVHMQKLVSQLVAHYQGNAFTFYMETAASVFQKYAQSYGLAHKQ